MTKEQKIIRAEVGLLGLAKQLGNVSQACKMMGYSREGYRFKELYDAGGELALQELTRRKPILKNRTPPEVETILVRLSLDQPAYCTRRNQAPHGGGEACHPLAGLERLVDEGGGECARKPDPKYHVWMPPLAQDGFEWFGRVIGCGHVSGL